MMLCYVGELIASSILTAAELFHFASVRLLLAVALMFGDLARVLFAGADGAGADAGAARAAAARHRLELAGRPVRLDHRPGDRRGC